MHLQRSAFLNAFKVRCINKKIYEWTDSALSDTTKVRINPDSLNSMNLSVVSLISLSHSTAKLLFDPKSCELIHCCRVRYYQKWINRSIQFPSSGLLLALQPSNTQNLWDGSACTTAATLRHKLHVKLAFSPRHSILTLGQPVQALIQ